MTKLEDYSKFIKSLREFINIKNTHSYEIISYMNSGRNAYNIVFIPKEELETYINLLTILLELDVTDSFSYFLFTIACATLGKYFENQYDDSFFLQFTRKLNKHQSRRIDQNSILEIIEEIEESSLDDSDLIIMLKLQY